MDISKAFELLLVLINS